MSSPRDPMIMQITAYGVITTSGQTGTVSTNQQFAFNGAPSYSEASSIGSTSSSPSSEGTPASSPSESSSGSTSVIQSAVASAGPAASAEGGQVKTVQLDLSDVVQGQ